MPPVHARLLGALLAGDGAGAARGLAALDAAGWAELLRLAGEDLLTPELAGPLAAPALAAFVPPEVVRHLGELRALNTERNARIAAQAAGMLPAFAAAGMRPLLLKGARDFADPEPERRDRVTGDLDLLFRPDELDAAAAVLQRFGYRRLARDAGPHALGYFVRAGEPAPVDLHHAPLRLPHLLPAEDVLARARRAAAFGAPVWILDPADEVLHRALHETVQHQAYRYGVASIRSLRGIAVRLPVLDPAGWATLRARAAGRAFLPAATAIRLVAEVFGSGSVPPEGAAFADHPLARLATWRTWAKAASRLPGPVDALLEVAARGVSAYEHRPGVDSSLTAWRVRRLCDGVRRALGSPTPR